MQMQNKMLYGCVFTLPSFPQLISVTVCRVHTTIETDVKTGSEIYHRQIIAEILLDKKGRYNMFTESGSNCLRPPPFKNLF